MLPYFLARTPCYFAMLLFAAAVVAAAQWVLPFTFFPNIMETAGATCQSNFDQFATKTVRFLSPVRQFKPQLSVYTMVGMAMVLYSCELPVEACVCALLALRLVSPPLCSRSTSRCWCFQPFYVASHPCCGSLTQSSASLASATTQACRTAPIRCGVCHRRW